ncbi:MAG: SPOR domain-containing protein, partial [Acidobacteriota bacterium]|nr:SPOR domain-containing protein [Acidobacteriota bacterium]
ARPGPATAAGTDSAVAQAPSAEPGADEADPAYTGGRTGGTVLIPSEDILVMDDLIRDWTDWYVVHISSFKESVKARDEVSSLESREFPVFIVFLDLGAKGPWYRVYSGPFLTREQALDVKKNLDDTPGVRFTRVSKVAPK